jgi:hypothetical protein
LGWRGASGQLASGTRPSGFCGKLSIPARSPRAGGPSDFAAIERLHAAKTGALFAAAAELGAIAAGAPLPTSQALGRFGMAIGIAFQHVDDRDDGELVEHAAAAGERIRVLGDEAVAIARPLPRGQRLCAIADWFASRA